MSKTEFTLVHEYTDTEGRTDADHIAQHDPAFVLADIAAKRAVISMFAWAVPQRPNQLGW